MQSVHEGARCTNGHAKGWTRDKSPAGPYGNLAEVSRARFFDLGPQESRPERVAGSLLDEADRALDRGVAGGFLHSMGSGTMPL